MILVNEPLFIGNEKKYLQECIDTGWISSDGPYVKEFEDRFAKFLGVKHAIANCNGTVAIELALAAIDIQPGDEVILPCHTIVSCPMGIVRRGAKPILVDVNPNTWTMDVTQLESKIGSKTKAIMPVHIFGHPCDMDPILDLAKKYNLIVIEDAAEAHGAEYKGKKCGSIGDLATFSFYANKIITTGEGGMVVTDNDDIAAKARYYRNLCFLPQQRFLHEDLGYNFRITNLQAAVGCAQMEVIDKLLDIKVSQGEFYAKNFEGIPGIKTQKKESWAKHVYWVNPLLLNDNFQINGLEFSQKLLEKGVQSRPFFWPLNEQPVFHKMGLFEGESYPVSEKIARSGIYVPSGMALKHDEMVKVVEVVKEIISENI